MEGASVTRLALQNLDDIIVLNREVQSYLQDTVQLHMAGPQALVGDK